MAVRPGNIILDLSAEPLRAVAGQSWPASEPDFRRVYQQQPLDTAIYLSLEQSGAIAREIGFTSDLYSAGIVLFECLTGRLSVPERRCGHGAVETCHRTGPGPANPREGIPRPLNDLVHRMLRKDSRDRYQCAEAVLADLEVIENALRDGNLDPDFVIGAYDPRRTLTEPAFVGRDTNCSNSSPSFSS